MRRILNLGVLAILGLLLLATPLSAVSESIRHFRSSIVVHADASMTVTETITVQSAGQEIRRGLVRDFPTVYQDRLGHRVTVGFQVQEVLRDGRPEPFRTEAVGNGVRMYIGKPDLFLQPGIYTYTITYRTNRQLGFFQDFDELYWNVTGNGWTFPIDAAEAVIELPPGARILHYAGYTGYQGERGLDFVAKPGDHEIIFETTRGLAPREGLTVAVAWPKGVVQTPSIPEKMSSFLRDNVTTAVSLLWLIIVGGFYLVAWIRVGRDPATGTIIPLFTPPADLSPPAVRFLSRMGFDHKAFAAAVVDMGVRGYLQIKENNGEYTLIRKNPATFLPAAEKRMAESLLAGDAALKVDNANHAPFSRAFDVLRENLEKEFDKVYFVTNLGYLVPGILLTLLAMGSIIFAASDRAAAFLGTLLISVWTVICLVLAVVVYQRWQEARSFGKIMGALGVTLLALPFFIGEIFGVVRIGAGIALAPLLTLLGMACLHILFYHLLKAPTLRGRRLMDQIEGFKMYLSVAEQDRLNLLSPPEKTPALFEKYLPYALALDVENEWSEQFAEVLARAQVGGQSYSPAWYSGDSWDLSQSSRFSAGLGRTLADAVSSAAAAPHSSSGSSGGNSWSTLGRIISSSSAKPGSSSGSRGRGSSGGGGGGGGGSGW